MKLAVIGAGWAGMAAVHGLIQAGHEVTIFELAHQLGGRARGVYDPQLGNLDNGQHLLIGAYQHTLDLIHAAHPHPPENKHTPHPAYWRLPLQLMSLDGAIQIQVPQTWSGRLARIKALVRAEGLNKRERWRLLTLLGCLSVGLSTPAPSQTVLTWLQKHQQSPRTLDLFWVPLCLATMNTAPEMASATLFAKILRDSLLNPLAGATDLIIPRVDLTELWASGIARHATIRLGAHIDSVTPLESAPGHRRHVVKIQGETFDGCIIATPPAATAKIVRHWPSTYAQQLCQALTRFTFFPITTCYVELDRAFRLLYPMMMLRSGHGSASTGLGQWVFDRNAILDNAATGAIQDTATEPHGKLAFVMSHAGHAEFDRQTLAQDLMQQLWAECHDAARNTRKSPCPTVMHSRVITEKRATFAAVPGLTRPSQHTDWPHIKLAGDWTDTGYPAVLEGAVISGLKAAEGLLRELQQEAG